MTESSKEEAKAARERHFFTLFAKAMSWPIDLPRIQSRPKTEPDILYDSADGKIAFELTANCSRSLAHKAAKTGVGIGETFLRNSDPSWAVVKKKLKKSYTTEHPIELLVYYDGRLVTPDSSVIETLIAHLDGSSVEIPFRRVWYFGKDKIGTLLWPPST
jgi:hypothetical protein